MMGAAATTRGVDRPANTLAARHSKPASAPARAEKKPAAYRRSRVPGRVRPPWVDRAFLAVLIEYIPIIGYTAGLWRRRGRPSREHRGEQSAMVSAGAVSCAPRGSIVTGPTEPCRIASERTRALSQGRTNPRSRSGPSDRCARTNPSRASEAKRARASWPRTTEPEPHTARPVQRARAGLSPARIPTVPWTTRTKG